MIFFSFSYNVIQQQLSAYCARNASGNYHNCHYKKIILLHDSLLNGSFHTELVLHVLVQIFHHSIQILQIGLVVILQSVTGMLRYEMPVIYAVLFQCGDQRLGCGKGCILSCAP